MKPVWNVEKRGNDSKYNLSLKLKGLVCKTIQNFLVKNGQSVFLYILEFFYHFIDAYIFVELYLYGNKNSKCLITQRGFSVSSSFEMLTYIIFKVTAVGRNSWVGYGKNTSLAEKCWNACLGWSKLLVLFLRQKMTQILGTLEYHIIDILY